MESSNFGQRALIVLSLMVLGVTGAAWWWVSQNPQSNSASSQTAIHSLLGTSQPGMGSRPDMGSLAHGDHHVDSAHATEAGGLPSELGSKLNDGQAQNLIKMAAFAQPPGSLNLPKSEPPSLNIPETGVIVPPANVGAGAPAGTATTPGGTLSYRGILAFVHDVKVVAQADGVIREFLVDEGTIVQKDAIIVEIDNRLARAEKQIAQKELESAQLKAEDESQIKFAIAAEEVAKNDFARISDLYTKGVSPIDEYERKQLELRKAQLSIEVSKREQRINQAAVGVNEAKVNASDVQIELRTIRAPFTGIVAKTEKENFEWVKGGDEILRLVSLDTFRVRGRVAIEDSPNILEGAPAKVLVQVQPGHVETVNGTVGFVEPEASVAVDGKNEYGVWVEIPNRIVNGQYLFRGKMNAAVEIYPKR